MSRYPKPPQKPLILLQINVGRGSIPHEIALSHAFSEEIDVLLVQEPYIYKNLSRRITKHHPVYDCFTPLDDWTSSRPRVLIYIRRQARLQTSQICPLTSDSTALPDLLFLHISARSGPALLAINIYNVPTGSIICPGEVAKALTQLPVDLFAQPILVAGDLNLLYPR